MRPDKHQSGFGVRRALSRQINWQLPDKGLSFFYTAVKKIDVAEKIVDEGIDWMMIDLFRRADLLDASFVHQNDPIGHFQGFFLIVSDKDAGNFQLVVKAPEPLAQLFSNFRVEGTEGLVQKQHVGFHRQGAGQGDSLALAPGELRWQAVTEPVQLHELQEVVYLFLYDFLRGPKTARAHAQTEGNILEDRHVPEQRVVLKDEADPAVAEADRRSILVVNQDGAVVAIGDFDPRNDS